MTYSPEKIYKPLVREMCKRCNTVNR